MHHMSPWRLISACHRHNIQKIAYVVQDDVLFAFLTVQETLTLAAHFHLPPSMEEEEKVCVYWRLCLHVL